MGGERVPMLSKKQIVERLAQLIEKGDRVLNSISPRGIEVEWDTNCRTLLTGAFGEKSIYVQQFFGDDLYKPRVSERMAVLRAAKEDVEGGYIERLESLLAAELFTSYLDEAEHLLGSGYKDAAAVLIGATMENTLRKMCEHHGVELAEGMNRIEPLKRELVRKKVLDGLTQKSITAWADIRNNAAHGRFDQYESRHVREMLEGVRELLDQHLAEGPES